MMLSDGEPFVPLDIVEYLQREYSLDALLHSNERFFSNDEHLGYMKGVQEVINRLHALSIRKDGEV